MNNGRMALCLAGGYLLGRFHKMRWALGLAGVAAGRRLRAKGAGALAEVLKAPALDQLQHLRGELLAAGRTAAVAMAGNRIDALSDKLQERAASLRTEPSRGRPEAAEGEEREEPEEREGREAPEGRGEREPRREQGESGGGGRGAVKRDREITRRRAERMLAHLTAEPPDAIRAALDEAGGSVKRAVLVLQGLSRADAQALLDASANNLRTALATLHATLETRP